MRIAFILQYFPTSYQPFVLNQITGLLDLGCNVDILAYTKPKEERVEPDVIKYRLLDRTKYFEMPDKNRLKRVLKIVKISIKISFIHPIMFFKSLFWFKYCRDNFRLNLFYVDQLLLESPNYDIIHCRFGQFGNLAVFLKYIGIIKGKILTQFCGYDLSQYIKSQGNRVYKSLFKNGDLLLPTSEFFKNRLLELGCDEKKIIVHREGTEVNKFKFSPKEKRRGDSIVKLLSVGRLEEKKGIEYGIQAVAKALKKFPNIEYKIVGDGDLRGKLESLIRELQLGNKVKLLGSKNRKDVVKLMKDSHILILPSVTAQDGEQEGLTVVSMEAQATGMPVVSTWHSGIPEVVQDGKSGFLVPERDVDALAERLEYLIEHPETWPKMGEAGRKFIEEHYDINKLNKRLAEIYRNLLS